MLIAVGLSLVEEAPSQTMQRIRKAFGSFEAEDFCWRGEVPVSPGILCQEVWGPAEMRNAVDSRSTTLG